ncbi:lipid-binding SYLF domain-containing protein [Paludisphaera mucosa]|uniref:YSC84-related protein n=1 Tax=Paludisphaera mucosa TaxID=3030827 RepID=A0ABT6FIA4_9BACT|nr:YSC84-related protein [Paludisphaera mucosa]MDG3007244.1 YSC84-related protein [Paludisphaera mucosa]
MRTPTRLRLAALSVVLGLTPLTAARAQKPPDVVVGQASQAMSEVTRNPKTGMPRLVMRKAQGIAIIPGMFKAGFVIGARFGRGVLLVRQPDGTWSNPVFIHLMGGSFGFQAGAQKTDLILVFQTQRGLDRFIKGRDKLTLGVDVGAAAGPVGKRFEAGTDVALKSEILSYSNSRGVFAGVSAEGGTLQIDWRANMNYYGRPVSVGEILAINSTLPVPVEAESLQALLAEKTASPVPVAPGEVIQGETIILEGDDVVAPRTTRATPAPRTRPRVVRPEPIVEDGDLDPLPSAKPAPRPSTDANDEDLPSAVPDPRPARPENQPLPRVESKPKPKPSAEPDDIDLDDVPPLDPPKP